MYTNPGAQGKRKHYNNINLLTETDFSVVPENTLIWEGELPFKEGDTFPTAFIRERANRFKTNDAMYSGEYFEEIFTNIFNFNDYLNDILTNMPILRLVPALPDFPMITDTWTDLIAAKMPKIDGSDIAKISAVSSSVSNSNFAVSFQQAVKGALFKYGNAVYRVDKQTGGNAKSIEMPIKNWIPFVNEEDVTTIDVNGFFNIFKSQRERKITEDIELVAGQHYCEFLLYHEDGNVEKYIFEYDSSGSKLGRLLGVVRDKAFGGLGVSPIVVFTGPRVGNSIYGIDAYRKWEPAIVAVMKAFETILILLERTKEITRVVPLESTKRDERTGITYMRNTGYMGYDSEMTKGKAPEVRMEVPTVPMEEAISAYKEALVRLSRDTDLSYTLFDTKELGTQMTGKALKTAMYRTELKAKSLSTLIINSAKSMVVKLALASGVDIDPSDFTLTAESGFVNDIETVTEIVQKRNGGATTLDLEDSIAILDDISMAEAEARARRLRGEPPVELPDLSNTDSGEESEVSDVQLTHESSEPEVENKRVNASQINRFYPIGGESIGED